MPDDRRKNAYRDLMRIGDSVLKKYIPSFESLLLSEREEGLRILVSDTFAEGKVKETLSGNGDGYVIEVSEDKYAELYPQKQEEMFKRGNEVAKISKEEEGVGSLPYVKGKAFILHDGNIETIREMQGLLEKISAGNKPEKPILFFGANGAGKTASMSYLGWEGLSLKQRVSYTDIDSWAKYNYKHKGEKDEPSLESVRRSNVGIVDSVHKVFYGETYRTKCGEDLCLLLDKNLKDPKQQIFLSITEPSEEDLENFLNKLSKKNPDLSSRIGGIRRINVPVLGNDKEEFLREFVKHKEISSQYVKEVVERASDTLREEDSFRIITRKVNEAYRKVSRNNRMATNQRVLFKGRSIDPILDIMEAEGEMSKEDIVGFKLLTMEAQRYRSFAVLFATEELGLPISEIAPQFGGRTPKEIKELAKYAIKTLEEKDVKGVMEGLRQRYTGIKTKA